MCSRTQTYMHTHTHVYTHTHTYTCTHITHVYTHMYTNVHAHAHTHVHTHMYTHTHAHTHTRTHIHTHIYIYAAFSLFLQLNGAEGVGGNPPPPPLGATSLWSGQHWHDVEKHLTTWTCEEYTSWPAKHILHKKSSRARNHWFPFLEDREWLPLLWVNSRKHTKSHQNGNLTLERRRRGRKYLRGKKNYVL